MIAKKEDLIIKETINQREIIGSKVEIIWYKALKLFLFKNGLIKNSFLLIFAILWFIFIINQIISSSFDNNLFFSIKF